MIFDFLTNSADAEKYLNEIYRAADGERDALGFLPEQAYKDNILKGNIIVAVCRKTGEYAGHIYFGSVYPRGKIFQTLVAPKFKRQKLGKQLVARVCDQLERLGYTNVVAKVADDLKEANQFYSNLGFETAKIGNDKKKKSNRLLNYRVKHLKNPTLFGWNAEQSSLGSKLPLPYNLQINPPTFLVDPSVIYSGEEGKIITENVNDEVLGSSHNGFRLGVSDIIYGSLGCIGNDLCGGLKSRLKRYTLPNQEKVKHYIQDIKSFLPSFPFDQSFDYTSKLNGKDLLSSLVLVLHYKLKAFVTDEEEVLKAASLFRSKFQVEILSSNDLKLLISENDLMDSAVIKTENLVIESEKSIQSESFKRAIEQLSILDKHLPDGLVDEAEYVCIADDKKPIAFAWWSRVKGPNAFQKGFVKVDFSNSHADLVFDHICEKFCRSSSLNGLSIIQLSTDVLSQSVTDAMYRNGFRPKSVGKSIFQKIVIGQVMDGKNWSKIRSDLYKVSQGLCLQESFPESGFMDTSLKMTYTDQRSYELTLNDFESSFHPALFVSGAMDAVVVPIIRSYSEDLFGTHEQLSLLPAKNAVLRKERVYFSDPRTHANLQVGRIIFFYESGSERLGRKAIIAVARIIKSDVMMVEDISEELLEHGVIDFKTLRGLALNGKMTVTYFDRIFTFDNPVGIAKLREIGCMNDANFVTATEISSNHMLSIIEEGIQNG